MSRQRPKRSKKDSRSRRAIVLLLIIAACLITLLTVLPSRNTAVGPLSERAEKPPVRETSPEQEEPQKTGAKGIETRQEQPVHSEAESQPASRPEERAVPQSRVAVVIDDVGYNLDLLEPFLDFPGPITLSVLPDLPHSRESARRIVDSGKELILHLPMEADGGSDPGPGAIRISQSDEEIRRLLDGHFSQVPDAVGMNNHMGSRATADERVMNVIMEYLHSEGRFFLDSRTTTETVGRETAGAHAVPYLKRDVFLDNDPEAEAIREALAGGLKLARKQGEAVLIGNVNNPQIAQIIRECLEEMERSGVELVTLSLLLKERS